MIFPPFRRYPTYALAVDGFFFRAADTTGLLSATEGDAPFLWLPTL